MNWLSNLVTPVLQTGVWAFVVFLIARLVLKKFEGGLNRTLDRLKKAGPAEFEPPQPAAQSESAVELNVGDARALPAPPGVLGRFVTSVRDHVENVPPHEKEALLVQFAATSQLAWVFEALNFQVLGSQLALLQALNPGPLPIDAVRGFYLAGVESSPEYYSSYSFDQWLHWLIETAHFVVRSEDRVSLSEEGREFLKYMIGRGYGFSRSG
jgi:hypothetical protein